MNPGYKHFTSVHNNKSAAAIVPDLLSEFKINSVLDVGCGTGSWLAVFQENGVNDVMGVDGDFVERSQLVIPLEKFVAKDLNQPLDLKRKFDLVVCLEVAEHIRPENAKTFIHNLTKHADMVIFSAAIPLQGGQNHLNEQWPEFWQKIFKENDFNFYDVFRLKYWEENKIEWWYKQNMFLVAKNGLLDIPPTTKIPIYIHPELYSYRASFINGFKSKYLLRTTELDDLLFYDLNVKDIFSIISVKAKRLLNKIKS